MPSPLQELRPIYTIDARDRLIDFNRAFVQSLGLAGCTVSEQALLGTRVWDFVAGAVTRQLWEVLYARVRAIGAPVFVPLRADTASERRLLDVELHPQAEQSIRHVRECVLLEARPAIALLDPNYPRDERELLRCAWCARIQVRLGSWLEVEQAQATLHLEASGTLPAVLDGACAACMQSVLKTFPARVA